MPKIQTHRNSRTGYKSIYPSQYDVIIHNDDQTTMEFVIHILMSIFGKSQQAAFDLMMQVHLHESGVAGTYFKDIAETKAEKARREARENGFPLRLTVEKVYDLPF